MLVLLGTTCSDILWNCGVIEEATRLANVLICCAWGLFLYVFDKLNSSWWSSGVADCTTEERFTCERGGVEHNKLFRMTLDS